jgi:hypothetical protein
MMALVSLRMRMEHSRWAMFNDFKEEDFTNMIMEYCRQVLGEDEFNSVQESVDDE